jgi:hypothetical protein
MPTDYGTLHTVADYEEAASSVPGVLHVRVRAAANDPRMPRGVVEVRARGPWRRRLSKAVEMQLRTALVERHPIGVELRLK